MQMFSASHVLEMLDTQRKLEQDATFFLSELRKAFEEVKNAPTRKEEADAKVKIADLEYALDECRLDMPSTMLRQIIRDEREALS